MIWIEKQYHHLFGTLDLVITEASSMRLGGFVRREKNSGAIFGHTGVPNLIELFKKYTPRLLFAHFGSWFYEDTKNSRQTFARLAKKNDIEIIVGYDGLELEL
jgi:hypothetical protein